MARSMWLSAEMWVARGEGARLAVSVNRRALGATGCWTGVNRADVAGAGWGVFRTENWWVALMKAKPRAMESVAVAQAVWRCQLGRSEGMGMGRVAERRSLQAVETCWKLEMGERAEATRSAQRVQAAR